MASNDLRGYIREPGTGTGQSGVTVSAKRHDSDATVTTDGTDANGLFEIDHDTLGYPGPVYWTATSGGDTIVRSGNVTGQINGLFYGGDIPDVFQALGQGVVPDIGGELACSADGTDMDIDIAAGLLIHKDGLPFLLEAADLVTLSNGDGANPRIDTVVVRLTREGQTAQGAIVLAVLQGTPAASPSQPTLTQSAATWEYPLCDVAVGTGVSTVSNGNITDRRTYAWHWPESVTASAFVATDANGQIIFDTAIDASLVGGGSVSDTEYGYLDGVTSAIQTQLDGKASTGHSHTFGIDVKEGGVSVDPDIDTLDFDSSDFNVTESPENEANISLNYGTSAGTPAEGNHVHTAYVGDFTQYFTASVNLGNSVDVLSITEPEVIFAVPEACT